MKPTNPPTLRHDWNEYCDGTWRLAEPKIDYDHPSQFRDAAKSWANRNGYTFTSRRAVGGLKFCFYPKESEAPEPEPAPPAETTDGAFICDHQPPCEHALPLHAADIGWGTP